MTSYVTKNGMDELKQELEDRKTKMRMKIAIAIKEAKEQGDLSENAEYAEAKRQQRENESRIIKLENIIRTSQVIAKKKANGEVQVGSEVEVKVKDQKMTFHIVGSNEANPMKGKISNESPIGRAFLGKKKRDKFDVKLPNGRRVEYKILKISWQVRIFC